MKLIAAYLSVGVLLTLAWNVQVQATCGKPLSYSGFVLGPIVMPILTPMVLWENSKPACDKMSLAGGLSQ